MSFAMSRTRVGVVPAAMAAMSVLFATSPGFAARNTSKESGPPGIQVDAPIRYRNLAIYVVRGTGIDSRRFLTLADGLAARTVRLHEEGMASGEDRSRVNELEIENSSDEWLFLQAGDVIQGGKQDRTIAIDIAIPPHSAPQPVSAFCVEHGRWTPRPGQRAGLAFRGNTGIVGNNALKRSIQAEKSQRRVWEEVARQEAKARVFVSVTGEAPVRALSQTGTYNAIVENQEIRAERARYVDALLPRLAKTRDAIGLVVAINGQISAADVYGSPALFQKLSRKLLESYALEAVLGRGEHAAAEPPPSREAARSFLEDVSRGAGTEEKLGDALRRTTKQTRSAVAFEYEETDPRTGARTLLHRSVVKN